MQNLHILTIPETNIRYRHSWAIEQFAVLNALGIENRVLYFDFEFIGANLSHKKIDLKEIETERIIYRPLVSLFPSRYQNRERATKRKRFENNLQRVMSRYIQSYGKPDVIHAHNALAGGVIAQKISELFKIPYVVTEHNSLYMVNGLSDNSLKLSMSVFSGASKVISVSSELGKTLAKNLVDQKKIEIIGNVLPELFEQKLTNEYLTQTKDIIVTVNNLIPRKRVDLIIEAFRRLSNGENKELWIIGDGPERKNLEKIVNKNQLRNVFFLGHQDRNMVRDFMMKANLYVHTSKYETFGVSLLEAAACGLPIVSVDSIGNKFITSFPNVTIVGEDVDDIAQGISESLSPGTKFMERLETQKLVIDSYGSRSFYEKIMKVFVQVVEEELLKKN